LNAPSAPTTVNDNDYEKTKVLIFVSFKKRTLKVSNNEIMVQHYRRPPVPDGNTDYGVKILEIRSVMWIHYTNKTFNIQEKRQRLSSIHTPHRSQYYFLSTVYPTFKTGVHIKHFNVQNNINNINCKIGNIQCVIQWLIINIRYFKYLRFTPRGVSFFYESLIM